MKENIPAYFLQTEETVVKLNKTRQMVLITDDSLSQYFVHLTTDQIALLDYLKEIDCFYGDFKYTILNLQEFKQV